MPPKANQAWTMKRGYSAPASPRRETGSQPKPKVTPERPSSSPKK